MNWSDLREQHKNIAALEVHVVERLGDESKAISLRLDFFFLQNTGELHCFVLR